MYGDGPTLDYSWRYLETIMNKSAISPTEWPADYFAQQSSDASCNFIKELSDIIRAVTLNSHIKKHKN